MLDRQLAKLLAKSPNMAVPWYLMASYLYYHEDIQLLSDSYYDQLCAYLKQHWDSIEHRHKSLVPYDCLSAGTGFTIPKDKYPSLCVGGASDLVKKHRLHP